MRISMQTSIGTWPRPAVLDNGERNVAPAAEAVNAWRYHMGWPVEVTASALGPGT